MMTERETLAPVAVTIAEAAEMAHVGYAVVAEWAKKESTFPAFKVGKHTLIPVEPFRDWINERGKLRVGIRATSSAVAELIDMMRPEGEAPARQRARASKRTARQIEKGNFEEVRMKI